MMKISQKTRDALYEEVTGELAELFEHPELHINNVNDRYAMLEPLKDLCLKCRMCNLGWNKARGERDPHVFSSMKKSPIMIVGQNPGWNELEQGEPFVGAAGSNFDAALKACGHSRDEFYITNTVKCFSEGNTKPSEDNIKACESFLKIEFNIIKPKLVVALGAVAFERLCGKKLVFSENLGKIVHSAEYNIKVYVAYHPSPMNLSNQERKGQFNRQIKVLCALLSRLQL